MLSPREGSPLEIPPPERDEKEENGGIVFSGTLEDVHRANLVARCASRILVRMPAFHAAAFPELRRKAAGLPWERFLSQGQTVAFRVSCRKSRLYHGEGVAERIAAAVQDRLGYPVPRRKWHDAAIPDGLQLILARIVHDECTLSIDSSGSLLHKRGYRLATAKAPLRETLACAMLFASQWDKASPLLDPFCGSGTLPIEAALLALGIAPGRFRHFAFMNWPGFDAKKFKDMILRENRPKGPPPLILASDRDRGAIRFARENAERCNMSEFIRFSTRSFSAVKAPSRPGWVVSNPPFGIRVKGRSDLRNLYARLGKVLKAQCPGWQVALLSSNRRWVQATGLGFDSGHPVLHGGKRV